MLETISTLMYENWFPMNTAASLFLTTVITISLYGGLLLSWWLIHLSLQKRDRFKKTVELDNEFSENEMEYIPNEKEREKYMAKYFEL